MKVMYTIVKLMKNNKTINVQFIANCVNTHGVSQLIIRLLFVARGEINRLFVEADCDVCTH